MRWDQGAQPILNEIRTRSTKGVAAYETRQNTLKREVYRFVRNLQEVSGGLDVIEVAVVANCKDNPRTVTLQQNPFFWALYALAGRAELKPYQVTRFAQEMLYAARHGIDPDLFIGFVMQTGAKSIYAARPSQFESWYVARERSHERKGGEALG